jgi:hypothetical protein
VIEQLNCEHNKYLLINNKYLPFVTIKVFSLIHFGHWRRLSAGGSSKATWMTSVLVWFLR